MNTDLRTRFERHFSKGDGCWEWTASLDSRGYGQFAFKTGGTWKPARAHRIAYLLEFGDLAPELCVCHKCDNPKCVRPDHLFLGTKGDNNRDMVQKGRHRVSEKMLQRLRAQKVFAGGFVPKGELHGMSKLTWNAVREIRALKASGATLSDLVQKFSVAKTTIVNVVVGKSWKE